MTKRVIYSYFDNESDKRIQSSEGVNVESTEEKSILTSILQKWKTQGYAGNILSVIIERIDE